MTNKRKGNNEQSDVVEHRGVLCSDGNFSDVFVDVTAARNIRRKLEKSPEMGSFWRGNNGKNYCRGTLDCTLTLFTANRYSPDRMLLSCGGIDNGAYLENIRILEDLGIIYPA